MKLLPITFLLGALAVSASSQAPAAAFSCKIGSPDEAVADLTALTNKKEYSSRHDVWNCLAVAYAAKGDLQKARKSAERAVDLAPGDPTVRANLAFLSLRLGELKKAKTEANRTLNLAPDDPTALLVRGAVAYIRQDFDAAVVDAEHAIRVEPAKPDGYLLLSNVLIGKMAKARASGSPMSAEVPLLLRAQETLDLGLAKVPPAQRKAIEEERKEVRAFADYYRERTSSSSAEPNADDSNRLIIKKKTPPRYTEAARASGTRGTIRLLVFFGASGKVERVIKLSSLGNGLDEEAIKAARSIVFEPATKNGKPVSVVKVVEFTFDIS